MEADEPTWWWNLNPPQDEMREALEAEGFPAYRLNNRMPVFEEEVDMERVKEIALALHRGTYYGPEKKKRKRRTK
jgi:hypothetical protein